MSLYFVMLLTHIITAVLLIATVLFADHKALLWVLGKKDTLPKEIMHRVHRGMYIGLGIMILSGIYLFLPLRAYLLYEPAFQAKMGFLLALLLNSLLIGKLLSIATTQTFTTLPRRTQLLFLVSGGVSVISWIGVIVAANLTSV